MGHYRNDRRGIARANDRRREQRAGASLKARLILSEAFLHRDMAMHEVRNIELYGYVRDLSTLGVGIVIPYVSFDTQTCSEGLPILLTLLDPKVPVEVQVETIHCGPLNLREPGDGCVVGAKLGEISEQTRSTITPHLRQASKA